MDIQIPSPQDDADLKYSLWQDPVIAPTLESDRKTIYELEEMLHTSKESQLKAVFGPAKALDDSYVLPFCRHTGVGFSGLGYKGEEKMYFLPIGDIGGVLVFPYGDRDFISAVALYLKINDTFHPLKNRTDLKARREWDRKRFAQLETAILETIKTPNKALDKRATRVTPPAKQEPQHELFPRMISSVDPVYLDWISSYAKSQGWQRIRPNTARLLLQPDGIISAAYEVRFASGDVCVYPGTHDKNEKWTFPLSEKAKNNLRNTLNSQGFRKIPERNQKTGADGISYFIEADIDGYYRWLLHWEPEDPLIESVFKIIHDESMQARSGSRK